MITHFTHDRCNAGKSTLLNQIVQRQLAKVSSVNGTTRDSRYVQCKLSGWYEKSYTNLPTQIIDTGAIDAPGDSSITNEINMQIRRAIEDSHIVVFLISAERGVSGIDMDFTKTLRKLLNKAPVLAKKPATIASHRNHYKADTSKENGVELNRKALIVLNTRSGLSIQDSMHDVLADTYALGFGDPIIINAQMKAGAISLIEDIHHSAAEYYQKNPLILQSLDQKTKTVNVTETIDSKDEKIISESSSVNHDPNDENTIKALDDMNASKNLKEKEQEQKPIHFAIMGRPNVGKSTLMNSLTGKFLSIVGPIPGMTRDKVQATLTHKDREYLLVDTAGLTRITRQHLPKKLNLNSQKYDDKTLQTNNFVDSTNTGYKIPNDLLDITLDALRYAQVVVLVIEWSQRKLFKLDMQIIRQCQVEGRALVIAVNKIDEFLETVRDTVNMEKAKDFEGEVSEHIGGIVKTFGSVPIVAISGKSNIRTKTLMQTISKVHSSWSKRIGTNDLNRWLIDLSVTSRRPRKGKKEVKIKFITQVKTRPPTFTLFCNSNDITPQYEKFIANNLQNDFGLHGVPIRIIVRKTEGSAVIKKKLRHGKLSTKKVFNHKVKIRKVRLGKKRTDPVERWKAKGFPLTKQAKKKSEI